MYSTDRFKKYLFAHKESAPATINAYINDVSLFLKYLGDKDPTTVTKDDLWEYKGFLSETKEKTTVNRAISSLKSFYEFLVSEERISISPAKDLKSSKKDKKLPKYISFDEVMLIREAASEKRLKDLLFVDLLYGTGGRVSEIAALKVEDINFDEGYISLFGKGNKQRENPIHMACIENIRLYMKENNISEGYLFPHRFKPTHITRVAILDRVKELADWVGIDKSKVSPHVFRHSFATHLADNGCDLAVIQEYLGHENIATTRIYAQITKTRKSDSFKKFHPFASSL